jgi:hypothetical protein
MVVREITKNRAGETSISEKLLGACVRASYSTVEYCEAGPGLTLEKRDSDYLGQGPKLRLSGVAWDVSYGADCI